MHGPNWKNNNETNFNDFYILGQQQEVDLNSYLLFQLREGIERHFV